MIKNFLLSIFLLLIPSCFWGNTVYRPQVSVAGFIPLSGSGRDIYNFNPGWRYYKGDMERAETVELDDSDWEVVATPHSVELMPAEASGCRNYQGPVWYRKWFVIPAATRGKQVFIHFEAVMGKQKVYLNGHLVKEHLGGYLPFNIDLTANGIQAGDSCLIAVMADNSDDKSYPPGKRQYTLDFSYHGGIYRDVWMIAKSDVSITDAVDAGKVAGGGVFIHYGRISEKKADILIDTEVRNNGKRQRKVEVESSLVDATGTLIKRVVAMVHLDAGQSKTVNQKIEVRQPHLWSPDSPYLYRVESRVKEGKNTLDGGITRAGIRKAEFKGKEGFWLNGKPFGQLIGANRHQDFAYVGNALPNSGQWRDAKKLRDAGCRIIRVAHYPQDPSFMDACDELGMFVIVATPGWQYWNKEPEFARLVHENTRQLIDSGFRAIKIPAQRLLTPKGRVYLNTDEMMKMFHLMERKNILLSIDLADGALQTEELREVIAECPDLKIAIGHFGMVTRKDWKEQIRLASAPNVRIESGGITWLFNDEFYPFTGAVRAIKEAAGLVGMEKLMWGSDYPRTITAITYRMSYDFILKSDLFTEEEKVLFLGRNAEAFYGFKNLKKLPYIKNMSE